LRSTNLCIIFSVDNKIEIKPMGTYFELDPQGFVINPASIEKIQSKWLPAIQDVVEVYKKVLGDKLINIYIRGSVAKGQAVDGISDLDTYCFIENPNTESIEEYKAVLISYRDEIDTYKESIELKYNFISDIELQVHPKKRIDKELIMLSQSVCVFGEPFEIQKLKPGKDLASHSPGFERFLTGLDDFFNSETSTERNKVKCSWVMKRFLRTGFEICMERSNRYTRDLYKCYETFIEYYPEKELQMREILELALNPTSDRQKIKQIVDSFGPWLQRKINKYF
jgi:hypothetical protein